MFCRYCGQKIEDDSVFCSGCGKSLGAASEAKTSEGNNVTVQTGYSPLSNTRTASRPIWRTLYLVVFGLWALSAILMCVDWFSVSVLGYEKSGNMFELLDTYRKVNGQLYINDMSAAHGSSNPFYDIDMVAVIGLVITMILIVVSFVLFMIKSKICYITGILVSATVLFIDWITIISINNIPDTYEDVFDLTSAPIFLLIINVVAIFLLVAAFIKCPDKISVNLKYLWLKYFS